VTPATAATRSRTNGGCVGAVGGTHLILVFWRCCKGFAVPPHYRPSMPRRRVGNPEPMQHTQRVAGRAGSTPSTPAPLAGPTTRAARRHRIETEALSNGRGRNPRDIGKTIPCTAPGHAVSDTPHTTWRPVGRSTLVLGFGARPGCRGELVLTCETRAYRGARAGGREGE
jgi:hypothetical protein